MGLVDVSITTDWSGRGERRCVARIGQRASDLALYTLRGREIEREKHGYHEFMPESGKETRMYPARKRPVRFRLLPGEHCRMLRTQNKCVPWNACIGNSSAANQIRHFRAGDSSTTFSRANTRRFPSPEISAASIATLERIGRSATRMPRRHVQTADLIRSLRPPDPAAPVERR